MYRPRHAGTDELLGTNRPAPSTPSPTRTRFISVKAPPICARGQPPGLPNRPHAQRDTRTAHNCKRQGRPPAQPQSRVPTAQRVPHTFCRPQLRLIQLAPRAAPSTARTELRSCPSEGANAIVASRATVAEGLGRLLVPRPAASGPRSPGTRWREARWCLTGRRDRSPKPMNGSHEEKRDEPQRVVETVSQDWGPQGAVVDPQHAPHARVERHDDDAEESLLGVAETEKHG